MVAGKRAEWDWIPIHFYSRLFMSIYSLSCIPWNVALFDVMYLSK